MIFSPAELTKITVPLQMMEQTTKPFDSGAGNAEEASPMAEFGKLSFDKQGRGSLGLEGEELLCQDTNCISMTTDSLGVCQTHEAKLASLLRKNSVLEGQLAAAIAAREAAEKNSSSANKSRQEMEKRLGDAMKEMELLKEKLTSIELAQEEANNLSNIVHSDNVRLEHDVAFLKAVLDDTQKVCSLYYLQRSNLPIHIPNSDHKHVFCPTLRVAGTTFD